ncbi:18361_t:CDS:1, partial [Gigaspora margarita]
MQMNLTDKPELTTNTKNIKDFHITIPITISKQLVNTTHILHEIYYFSKLSEEWIDIAPITFTANNSTKSDLYPNIEELT